MSLIIVNYIPTGVVISGDSRTTYTSDNLVKHVLSDNTNKVFLVCNKYGVGTYGASTLNSLPIEHHIKEFEISMKNWEDLHIENFATDLLNYFRAMNPKLNLYFYVAGYDNNIPFVFVININEGTTKRININSDNNIIYGISRGGDIEIVNRLFIDEKSIPLFDLMNIQDAVDFSRHLIRTTIDQLRFEPRFPTVGGPIDTLLISPRETKFIIKKEIIV